MEKKKKVHLTVLQALNEFKIVDLNRSVSNKLYKDLVQTKSEWEKLFKSRGYI